MNSSNSMNTPTARPVNLVVDDLRQFRDTPEGVTLYARTSEQGLEALEKLSNVGVDMLWLDHDLGTLPDGTVDSIMPVVDWLTEKAYNDEHFPAGLIVIHTSNPVGRQNIQRALTRWGYRIQSIDAATMFIVQG